MECPMSGLPEHAKDREREPEGEEIRPPIFIAERRKKGEEKKQWRAMEIDVVREAEELAEAIGFPFPKPIPVPVPARRPLRGFPRPIPVPVGALVNALVRIGAMGLPPAPRTMTRALARDVGIRSRDVGMELAEDATAESFLDRLPGVPPIPLPGRFGARPVPARGAGGFFFNQAEAMRRLSGGRLLNPRLQEVGGAAGNVGFGAGFGVGP